MRIAWTWPFVVTARHMAVGAVLAALAGSGAQAQEGLRKLRADGPNAQALGQTQGYPACINALQQASCRVGTWSGGSTGQTRQGVLPSAHPWPLPDHASPPPIRWRWGLMSQTVDDYMDATQSTGLLILHKGQVVAERYQYDRQPGMPMRSFSMAKTFTAMLVGIAHDKGLIRSLDDRAADYWPEIAASAYGQTTIRNLLRMASGVPFRELYTWTPDDDNWVWGMVLYHPRNANQPGKIEEFLNVRTAREVEQGQRFHYASIETEILGRVLRRATGQSVARLTQDWLWQPMGAENAAHWLVSSTDGAEGVAGSFNASLRDYGRFGMLLANDGVRDGQAIIPREFLLDATDPQRQPPAFRPRVATPFMGYGYQTWLLPYRTRTFALQGIHGQTVYVQPASQIVMVQTAVHTAPSGRQDLQPYHYRNALWEGVLRSLGGRVD
ncbi:MAG: serine hydrolase domain-containing protein [Limnohabitans sp.]